MEIDLRKLFQGEDGFDRNSNGVIERQYELDLSGVELGGAKPFCAPVKVRARLRGFAGSVELNAVVEYTMSMPCDRCAEPVTREYTREFSHTLVRESREDTGEFITVPDERLDLDALGALHQRGGLQLPHVRAPLILAGTGQFSLGYRHFQHLLNL